MTNAAFEIPEKMLTVPMFSLALSFLEERFFSDLGRRNRECEKNSREFPPPLAVELEHLNYC